MYFRVLAENDRQEIVSRWSNLYIYGRSVGFCLLALGKQNPNLPTSKIIKFLN